MTFLVFKRMQRISRWKVVVHLFLTESNGIPSDSYLSHPFVQMCSSMIIE